MNRSSYDYCIIGSGPAGIVLADILCRSGSSVVLVDAGQADNLLPSKSVLHDEVGTHFKIPFTRSISVGGTSNLWLGGLSMFDYSDVALPGPNQWPFDYDVDDIL